ncbi:MAG: DUF4294 domain-containing protein [Bacteroidales bacterium]|nr:DUF4294 domain-containing protein [Bacteroidales bacterium]MCF8387350.1 DUF4294 domain-containing protein [Bacteroidales bacterium]MCF8396857.1 DUF4294 domain-containing protein [Bacteroidales bacterium]
MKKLLLIFLSVTFGLSLHAQQLQDSLVLFATIYEHDTIPVIQLDEVNVVGFTFVKTKRDARRMNRLIRHVKKVYPYAKLAGIKLEEYSKQLAEIEQGRKRRKLMKQVENEIEEEFGDDLRKLTFSQGKILIKLIDRETGNSSYKLVQDLRGKFSAFFYQAFARLFGYNLKIKYDPQGEDKKIELIVRLIESGKL